jgi:hypothetical protein
VRTRCDFSLLWLFSCAVGGWSAGSVAARSPESRPMPSSGTVRSIGKIGHRFKKVMSFGTSVNMVGGTQVETSNTILFAGVMEHGTILWVDVVIYCLF